MVLAFDRDFDTGSQRDFTIGSKSGARSAALRIDGDQASIESCHVNAAAAHVARLTLGIHPRRQPAAREGIAIVPDAIELGIEGPFLTASFGIERDDSVEGRNNIEGSIHKQGRGLEGALGPNFFS